MKRLLLVPTCFLLLLFVPGCGVAEVLFLAPSASEAERGESMGMQINTLPATTANSFSGETHDVNPIITSHTSDSQETDPSRQTAEAPPPTPTVDWNTNQISCSIRTDWPVYTVLHDDTLAHVARQANTTVATLVAANCLSDPDRLLVGQTIHIPQKITITSSPTPTPAPLWIHYADSTYQAEFDFPGAWQQVGNGINIRFEGEDGFVQLGAIGASGDLDAVTVQEASHKLMPYGKTPVIQPFTLKDGREARLILPSADQQGSIKRQATLITLYAEPVELLGSAYNYFQLVADETHIQHIAGTLVLPPPPATITIKEFTASTKDLQTGDKRITFKWTTSGATQAIIISGTAERFAPWWTVDASGELTVELDNTLFADPTMTLLAINDVSGEETSQTLSITWPCQPAYFFEPAPASCSHEAAQTVPGVLQQFQHGFMLWLSRPKYAHPSIYVFDDLGALRFFEDTWTENEPEQDAILEPPDGLFQPIRGFGKVWHESEWVRDNLGWATEAEYGYDVTFQPGAYESLQELSYISLPDSAILQLNGFIWRHISK